MKRSSVTTFLTGVGMMVTGGLGAWLLDPKRGESLLAYLVAFAVVLVFLVGLATFFMGICLLLDDVRDS